MRRYAHLGAREWDTIAEMRAQRASASRIAREIGRDRSTVCRELARNGSRGRCGAATAQRRADERRRACKTRPQAYSQTVGAMTICV
jgi:transposase, IS30 family